MTSIHLFNIEELKNSFKSNMNFLYNILNKHSNIKDRLEKLKNKYSQMIQQSKKKNFHFLFGFLLFSI